MSTDTNPDAVTLEWKKGFPTLDGDYYSRVDEYDKQPTAIRIESRTSQTAAAVYEFGCEKDLRREYESEDYEYLGPITPELIPALCATVRALSAITKSLTTENDLGRKQLTALREQLAENARRHFDDARELERQRDELKDQLAQVTQERDALRKEVSELRDEISILDHEGMQ